MKIIEITMFVFALTLTLSIFNSYGLMQYSYESNGVVDRGLIIKGQTEVDLKNESVTTDADKNGTLIQRVNFYADDKYITSSGLDQDSAILRAGNDILKSISFITDVIWKATFGLKSMLESLGINSAFAGVLQSMAVLTYIIGLFQVVSGRNLED